jgi:FkbM family methyltransferase
VKGIAVESRYARILRIQSAAGAHRAARWLPERDCVTNYLGYDFAYPSRSQIGRNVSKGLVWDMPLQSLVRRLAPEDVVCDIGSNIGASLLTMCSERPDLRFVCFEATPRFIRYLRQNVTRNGLDSQVDIHHSLIGPDSSEWTLSCDVTSGSVAVENKLRRRVLVREQMVSTSLDTWFAKDRPPGLVKVDTDGFEFQVLSSGRELFSRRRPDLFIEYCPQLLREIGDSPQILVEFLLDVGYSTADVYAPTGQLLKRSVPLSEVTTGPYAYLDLAMLGEDHTD